MTAARVLGCSALLMLAACGIGDTIVLGGGAMGGAAAPGGTGAHSGSAGDARMPLPLNDAATSDASDASPPDAGTDAGPDPSCASPSSDTFTACTPATSRFPLVITTMFRWPELTGPLRPQLTVSTVPLVANFTDDNQDGRIDLCDTPDILVLASESDGAGSLHLLSIGTGTPHRQFNARVANTVTPALADLDRDGDIEVVTFSPEGQLLIIDHTGEVQIAGASASFWGFPALTCSAVAIADLDGDNHAEIIGGYDVFNHDGTLRFSYAGSIDLSLFETSSCVAPIATNIQGDADLEVVFGLTTIQTSAGVLVNQLGPAGAPFVARTSDGDWPELLATDGSGLLLVREGGATGSLAQDVCASHPAAAVDIDHDGVFELAFGGCSLQLVELFDQSTTEVVWQNEDTTSSGVVTAFDLSGDGVAELIDVTLDELSVHDSVTGRVLTSLSDVSGGGSELSGAIVADVNNDGSAEVLVISENQAGPQLVVLGPATEPFAPARRSYTQYAYQPTHIDELGMTIARPLAYPMSHQSPAIDASGRLCAP